MADNMKGGVGIGVGSAMVFPSWILYMLGVALFAALGFVAFQLLNPKQEQAYPGKKKRGKAE